MCRRAAVALALAGALLGPCAGSRAQASGDTEPAVWPYLRGARQGHAPRDHRELAVRWSEGGDEIRWKTPLPGRGFSSPVVAGGTVWLTTALEDERSLRLLGIGLASGELRVDVEVFRPDAWQPGHPDNSYASPTPAASSDRVWVHFGTYGTAAYDLDTLERGGTEPLWRVRNTPQEHEVGPGSSPILVPAASAGGRDLLVVNADATDSQAVVALDATTGEVAWRTERFVPPGSRQGSRAFYDSPAHRKAFSTPLLYEYDGKPLLLSTGAVHTSAYDPASGRELWRLLHEGYSNVPTPVAGLGFAWVSSGYMKPHLLAVRLAVEADDAGSGVVEKTPAWSYHWQVPANPTPLLIGRRLFMVSDSGIATWLDAVSSEEIWRQRLGGRHLASPLTAGGRIYVWSTSGQTRVLAASDDYELLAESSLDAAIRATPAIADGALIVRTTEALYRIENRHTETEDDDD